MTALLRIALAVVVVITATYVVVWNEPAFAEMKESSASAANPDPMPGALPGGRKGLGISVGVMSNMEFWLSCIVLIFGFGVLAMETYLVKDVIRTRTSEIIRMYTVTLLVIGTLLLVTSSYTESQITPALGLFGTLAGYLLGKSDTGRPADSDHDDISKKP